jgi:hypothetical protein
MFLILIGISARLCFTVPTFYARASEGSATQTEIKSPILGNGQSDLFEKKEKAPSSIDRQPANLIAAATGGDGNSDLSGKISDLVGDAPIKEMIPFISKEDVRVAAFLVGIAQKESSLGAASPSKGGQDCYNYWGYKGEGGRGNVLGYSCFASAQEAVETVGSRIQRLVDNQRNTPSRMVDTWKCGGSCAGDPGAPSWVETVSQDFNKIVTNVG